MTRLVLVRHGETVGNSRIRYYGATDVELAEEGRAQMCAVARALGTDFRITPLSQIFTSPLRRARESAEMIASQPAAIVIEDFREVDFGDFEGLTATEIEARFPEEFARWNRNRLAPDYAYPRGESRAAFALRVERGVLQMLAQIDSEPATRSVLLVAHRGVIRTITRTLVSAEPIIELGSIQELVRGESGRWQIGALDYTRHLMQA
jgi:broad specificity phosphatase PhoE